MFAKYCRMNSLESVVLVSQKTSTENKLLLRESRFSLRSSGLLRRVMLWHQSLLVLRLNSCPLNSVYFSSCFLNVSTTTEFVHRSSYDACSLIPQCYGSFLHACISFHPNALLLKLSFCFPL